ncbi:MAG TPA: methyltransferase domain-containing protein [Candidatus Stackebrandtia excrementipullorum]|nr:methyltransferase domain-containing protein [Candidatus Stackebrandtia excrementipullorum]
MVRFCLGRGRTANRPGRFAVKLVDVERLKSRQPPRPSVVWSVVAAELAASPPDGSWRILDVGGGTGGFAVPLAEAGFQVTVVDTSPNALAGLVRRATEAGVAESITAMQGDADALASLVEPDSVRLVLCHSVLEMVDSPTEVTKAIASVLQPGGAASILVANRAGAVLSRALGGNLTAAMTVLADAEGRSGERDTLLRRFDPDTLAGLMATANLEIHQMHGVNVVADVVGGESTSEGALHDFELAVAATSPYRDIATGLHVLVHKNT